ncbi:hypothetical protein KI387_036545, partial [Taxus chinensis]
VTDIRGGNVATGMCEILGVDEVVFGVVVEGTVDVTGAMKVTYAALIVGMGPNYETTMGKVDVGSTKPYGANVGVGARVEGIDTGMLFIN